MKLILDTNTLLLFIVGNASKAYLQNFKRTAQFSSDEYDLLIELINEAEAIFTIPQVLTEASNLLSKGLDPAARHHVWANFQNFIDLTEEVYVQSVDGSRDVAFTKLGITDAILAILSEDNFKILTCDVPLFLTITSRGHLATNFYHEIGKRVA